MSTKKPQCKVSGHGKLDERGKCWDCLEESVKVTRRALSKTLTQSQRRLLVKYDKASEAWTSAVILD